MLAQLGAARTFHHLSGRAHATAAGLSRSVFGDLMNGHRWPRWTTLLSAARSVGLEMQLAPRANTPAQLPPAAPAALSGPAARSAARDITQELRSRRRLNGTTIRAVANRIGCERWAISDLDCGKETGSILLIAAYAVAVGLRLELRPIASTPTRSERRPRKPQTARPEMAGQGSLF